MLKKLKSRFIISFILVAAIFITVMAQLFNLTLQQGGDLTVKSEDKTVRTLTLKGTRGDILDVTGIPLAYDQSSFDIQFTKDPSKATTTDRAYYTDVLIKTIDLIEQNGGEVIDTFAIKRQEDGTFVFDFEVTDPEAVAARETNWRENMYVSKTAAPDVLYRDLRIKYRIPEEYTYEQARKLLSVWQEVQLSSYRAYVPVTVAEDVSMETVAVVEGRMDLDGISVAESSTRVYPKDDVAAHIIGYMGKMVDNQTITEMQEKGYSSEDTIGITGIESTMESFLTGNSTERQGQRQVEVNSRGKVIKEIFYVPPSTGNSVMLTVDLELQMELERALEENIQTIYEMQVSDYYANPEKYDQQEVLANRKGDTTLEKMNLAKSGAAIVMDVNTGNILAMASYPSYDLNLFEGGIEDEAYQALLADSASPLFNKAIASKGIPGSIFKMVTGTAGLAEGSITADTVINDEGEYTEGLTDEYKRTGGKAPACWIKPYYSEHGPNQTITEALKDSCNYFFFVVADQYLGIDKLKEWSDKFGLTEKTGIELPGEVAGQVGCQETLYDWTKPIAEQKTSLPLLVRNQIIEFLKLYGTERNVEYPQELLEETATTLLELVSLGKTAVGAEIRAVLSEKMEIPATIASRNGWDNDINASLVQLMWNRTRTAETGIGTNLTALTPIGVARYISALVNGGTVYEAHIVDSIIDANGNVVEERQPEALTTLGVSEDVLDTIKEGMREVVSEEDGGLAAEAFEGWQYKNTAEKSWIGGKTGSGKVNDIDLENNAWFVAFAPYDDPEIAVVIYIPNGKSGASSAPAARDIIGYYLDGKQSDRQIEVPGYNSLVP